MSQIKGWKRKIILLFKSEKRLGANQVASSYSSQSYDKMKETLIDKTDVDLLNISEKVRAKDLSEHLNKVKKEFIGQPELNFYHATLIILLRRGYKPTETFSKFEKLWETESDFLLNNLSLRWIVSACDTFVDCSQNRLRASIMMNVVTLINMLKVYETQQFLYLGISHRKAPLLTHSIDRLYECDLPLYDGLTYFRIGSDDTLRHMRQRYNKFNDSDELATSILLFVFNKLQTNDSAFSTIRSLHIDERSKWWDD